MKNLMKVLMVSGIVLTGLQAKVDITSVSQQKVQEGKKSVWKKATTIIPGTVIRYLNTVTNDDREVATNLVVVNNISQHMEYQTGTATCSDQCDITYAVDLKEGYKAPSELYVIDPKTKLKRLAKAKEYRSIKWTIKKLNKDAKTTLQYEAKLK